jgi:hypothetical protein
MKPATFKKVYITETVFEPSDLIQFINAVHDGNASFKERAQFEEVRDSSSNKNLLDIFRDDSYRIEYLGKDSLNSYHLFNITNGLKKIEIIMKPELFDTCFQVI